jgi:hypothetical protein
MGASKSHNPVGHPRPVAGIIPLYVLRYHLSIPEKPPDDALSAPKYVVSGLIKTFVFVTVTT